MNEELKSCPFCGGPADILELDATSSPWLASCASRRCSVEPEVDTDTRDEAITAWNTRAPAIESGIAAEMHRALELIAALGGLCLLGPAYDTERMHELGSNKAFDQAASIARDALLRKAESKGD